MCSKESLDIRLMQEGNLKIVRDMYETVFDFNAAYQGFYPCCRFTAVFCYRRQFYAAGTDETGTPHLFSSASGEIWEEEVIVPQNNPSVSSAYGPIVSILSNEKEEQLILVSRNGFIVTLSGCPKCVRIKQYPYQFCEAEYRDSIIYLNCTNDEKIQIHYAVFLQYRTSWSYAQTYMKQGAVLIDLREETKAEKLPGALICEEKTAFQSLKDYPKEQHLFYFCESGGQADSIVEFARYCGYIHAFSLGGIQYLKEKNDGHWPV